MTKALLIFPLLLAAILWTSPSAAEICQSLAARADLAAALRLAAEARPVCHLDVGAAGVSLPGWLAAQHESEMTIVLQHEFDRLVVKDDRFEVGLWFKRRYARLVVPFAAVKGLWDDGKLKCGSA
ncbi:MAG: ClpXP protease specificity-enhancing factor SspB [Gammaproteobacteria bacterium]